ASAARGGQRPPQQPHSQGQQRVPDRPTTQGSAPGPSRGRGRGGGTTDTRGPQGRVFELRSAEEPAAPTATGTIFIYGSPVRVLFDTGATHSFISDSCVEHLGLDTVEGMPFIIGLPNGGRVRGTREIHGCPIFVGTHVLLVDFFVMSLEHEEVILGMDWMDRHSAVLDVGRRTVTLSTELGQVEVFRGWDLGKTGMVISAIRAARLIAQGCEAFWCYAMKEGGSPALEDIPVACDFTDVFAEPSSLPPQRSVDFGIDLEPGTRPISKAPYRMAPVEMLELKRQLEELAEKGFIRP
ncbi:hypothetical protein GP644_23620, partial [Parasedimentitalea maritima]